MSVSRAATVLGTVQFGIAVFGVFGLVACILLGMSITGNCMGLGCVGAVIAYGAAALCFCLALLGIPAWAWLNGKRWAMVVNVIALVPLVAMIVIVVAVLMEARYKPAPAPAPAPAGVGAPGNAAAPGNGGAPVAVGAPDDAEPPATEPAEPVEDGR